jgi:hypothetical protein
MFPDANFQPNTPHFSTQRKVYNDIGEEMLQHAFEGNQITNAPGWNINLNFKFLLKIILYL